MRKQRLYGKGIERKQRLYRKQGPREGQNGDIRKSGSYTENGEPEGGGTATIERERKQRLNKKWGSSGEPYGDHREATENGDQ